MFVEDVSSECNRIQFSNLDNLNKSYLIESIHAV